MTDPHSSATPTGDPPHPVAEAEITRVVNVGRVKSPSGVSALAPVRPSSLLSERLHRPATAGRFVITGEIARGGMGVIYRGHDLDLGRDLAIKVLKPEWGEQPDIATMFLNEARICGRLQHPGIVPIHEAGTMGDGSPFIAMKLVEGQTFARLLADRGRSAYDLQRILRIFEAVCQTLAYAHARGIVHRDLKPSNIMVGPFNEVQVMDWGLACEEAIKADPTPIVSEAGSVMGTPAYMAPEQARGTATPNVRIDVFALGAILCEILTGEPPFAGGDGGTFDRASKGEIQPALDRLHDEGLDPDLVALACRCLSVDPALRPGDAGLIATALGDHQSNVQERLRQAELHRAAAEARVTAECRYRRLLVSVVILILLGAVGGLSLWEKSRRGRFAVLAARSARMSDLVRGIEGALSEAELLRAEARAQGVNPVRWEATLTRARAAVERASKLADEDDLDDWKAAVALAHRQLEADDRDRLFVGACDGIRLTRTDVRPGRFDAGEAARRYERAFAEAGINLFGLPIEAVATLVRERPIREHLVEAIEEWACLLPVGEDRRNRLLTIAGLVAPDPWRDRLRHALRIADRSLFLRLAEAPPAVPPACQILLANALVTQGESARAIALLRQVREHHPADFWVNQILGYRLHQAELLVEALRFYTAAQAVRQDSPGLFHDIGVIHAKVSQKR